MIDLNLFKDETNDVFWTLKNNTVSNIKNILSWANKNGLRTEVTMLDVYVSAGRIKSDKDFQTVLSLVNRSAKTYFRIILRKNMNLFLILYNRKVIRDVLEIAIRGIDVDSKEYFIMIYLKKEFLKNLSRKYDIKRIN